MHTPYLGPLPLVSDLPTPILQEIGKICVAFSRIEWLLNKIIYDVLNVTAAEGRLAVRDPVPDHRVDLIEELMKLKNIDPKLTNAGDLKTSLKEAKTKRDAVAHGVWLRPDGESTLFLRLINGTWAPLGMGKTKRRMLLEGLEFTSEDAKAWRELIESTLTDVQAFHAAIIAEMNRMVDAGTLHDKRPEPSLHPNHSRDQTGDKTRPPPESSGE
jgi:hypothetical protein